MVEVFMFVLSFFYGCLVSEEERRNSGTGNRARPALAGRGSNEAGERAGIFPGFAGCQLVVTEFLDLHLRTSG
jgi:hypothetical protein